MIRYRARLLLTVVASLVVIAIVWHFVPRQRVASTENLTKRLTAEATPTPALTVSLRKTPRFGVRRYNTTGVYMSVSEKRRNIRNVNQAIKNAILDDQRKYESSAIREVARYHGPYKGVYKTGVNRRLVSASTVVVSALIPVTRLYPAGTDGQGWISITALTGTGERIILTKMLENRKRDLPKLSSVWKNVVRTKKPTAWRYCVAPYLPEYTPDFEAFALTPKGIAIAFRAEPGCLQRQATIPFSELKPYVSAEGKRIIAGVRAPRWSKVTQ
jgi:hypothetical protein